MKLYNFDEIVVRKNTSSVKWEATFKSDAQKIFPLWVADMDFPCSDAILDALHERVDTKIFGYNLGFDENYKQAVCTWFQKRFDWEIDPASIVHCGGVVSAIAYLLDIMSNEGDGIIIQTPVYYPFRKKIEVSKRIVIENPLCNQDGNYTMDFRDLEEKMKRPNVKGMILCSPHNPVGRVWTKEELYKVVELAEKYDIWIIADEIHCDLVREGIAHHPLLKIAPWASARIVVCTAPSKTFNLAGLQNSNIILPNAKVRLLWKRYVQEHLSIANPNSFALSATIAAYQEGEEWLHQVNAYIDENLKWASQYLKQQLPKAIVSPTQGTYLLWVDVRAYCSDEKKLEEYMVAHGLIFDEGYVFGEAGKGFERINVACPKQLLEECLAIFVKALQEL